MVPNTTNWLIMSYLQVRTEHKYATHTKQQWKVVIDIRTNIIAKANFD